MVNNFDKAFNKKYNIEWYLGDGKIQTTSATLIEAKDGFIYFVYPNGGLFIVEQKALRSMACIEDRETNTAIKCGHNWQFESKVYDPKARCIYYRYKCIWCGETKLKIRED